MGPFKFIGSMFATTSNIATTAATSINTTLKAANIAANTLVAESAIQLAESKIELEKKLSQLPPEVKAEIEKLME